MTNEMDRDWYRNALKVLKLTQASAAKMLGIDERTSRRYALGESRVPYATKQLLEYAMSAKKTAEKVAATRAGRSARSK